MFMLGAFHGYGSVFIAFVLFPIPSPSLFLRCLGFSSLYRCFAPERVSGVHQRLVCFTLLFLIPIFLISRDTHIRDRLRIQGQDRGIKQRGFMVSVPEKAPLLFVVYWI